MRRLDPKRFFPNGSHPGGVYLPNTVGPAILEERVLPAIAAAVPPAGLFVELGTWCGALAAHLADAHPGATILSVDTFADHNLGPMAWWMNARENMRLFVGRSAEFFDLIRAGNTRPVGILIDADHREAGVLADLREASATIAPGGRILAHDYGDPNWTGVKAAVDRFCSETGWTIEEHLCTLVTLAPPPPKALELDGRRMRVGFLLPWLTMGGAERSTVKLIQGLDPDRFELVGLAIHDEAEVCGPLADQVLRRCPITKGDAAKKALADQSDVLIIWGLHSYGRFLHEFHGRAVFVSRSVCDWQAYDCRCASPWMTDRVAISAEAAKSWPDPSRVTMLHNGIDTRRCEAGRSCEQTRADWGLAPDEIALGYVGRLSDEKNPLAAVKAAQYLGKPYRAVLVGDGPKATEILARARGILPDVIHRPHVEAIGEVYRAIDCLVMASQYEGFCNAIAEAWYCGCPVITTPVGVIPEATVAYGRLAAVVPMNPTPDDLAAAVKEAASLEFRATVKHAEAVVREHWTAEAACRRWGDYLAAMADWGRGP